MRIFVTNDDGIESGGLHSLAQRLADLGEVTVFAPSGEYSGAGASIGHLGEGVPPVHTVDRPELSKATAVHHLDGPPALATLLAFSGLLGPLPDIVVSGINPGWNVGTAVHFSGTIGACITASVFGVPGIAVSQHVGAVQHWDAAAEAAAGLVDQVLAHPRLLNVNVPNLPFDQLKGTVQTELSDRIPYGLHDATFVPGGSTDGAVRQVTFQRGGEYRNGNNTDTGAVETGFVSVTEITPTHATPNSAKLVG